MTPVQITEDSRLSDERLRKILAGLHPEDTYAGFPRKTSIYNSDLRALVTEVLAARDALEAIADGEGDAQEIAIQTLAALKETTNAA